MDKEQKLDLIAKMIEEYSDTKEIAEFLTEIAGRLKRPEDIAKERWASVPLADRIILMDGELGPYLVCRDNKLFIASDEQMQVMAAAPELLEMCERMRQALERAGNAADYGGWSICVMTEFAEELNVVIQKARGGESDA